VASHPNLYGWKKGPAAGLHDFATLPSKRDNAA
jgi:hypothetical protein